jgi:Na+-driven multidrug efflux pump
MRKTIMRLALPAMGERLLTMTVGIVDTILVGHLGAFALTAVSLANEWTLVVNAVLWCGARMAVSGRAVEIG